MLIELEFWFFNKELKGKTTPLITSVEAAEKGVVGVEVIVGSELDLLTSSFLDTTVVKDVLGAGGLEGSGIRGGESMSD